jgi:nucleoid-associated protein YgaU
MKQLSIIVSALLIISCAKQAVPQAEPAPDETAMGQPAEIPAVDDEIVVDPYAVDRGEGSALPENVVEPYMIKRGDFLIKIARQEYGDGMKWRDLYEFNRDVIGDNPNLIYPFNFLNLLKPAQIAKDCQVDFYDYVIQEGDTPWFMAQNIYGDELAWIIIYLDNEDLISGNNGIILPGMVFKLRKNLDPCG